jgi:mannose-6-phosphate isomerase-like protein (cupin superfamily)
VSEARSLERFPLHLGLGAKAVPQPEFTSAMEWYMDYGNRSAADGAEGRLVAMHTFTESWASWEMHPAGDEVVLCTSGEMTVIQQFPEGREEQVTLKAGDYAVNPPGVWHTADIAHEATAVFITCGLGTENRAR